MQTVTPQILADLMNSLHRFFKIGIYYPDGHTIADQVAASVLSLLRIIAGKKATYLRFVVSENTLSLQSIELDHSLASVKHFHDLLYSLRISILDIHRDITADEFRLFLSRLLFLRTKIQHYSDFQQIEITGMPSTIKISQLTFLASQSAANAECSGDSSQPTIDYLLSSLVQHGLHEEQVSMCRQLLETIPEALEKRQISESDLPSVTWDDVEKLLRNVAKSIHSEEDQDKDTHLPEQHQNVDALVAILKSIEGTAGGTKSREAVNLLMKVAKGTPPKSLNDKQDIPEVVALNEQPTITIKELYQAIEPLKKISLPVGLGKNSRAEELSVIMQMLGQKHQSNTTLKMQKILRDCLSAPLEPREYRIVVRGMRYLLATLGRKQLEAVLLMFLEILRRSEHTTPLRFLYDVSQELSKEELITCWPFLMNEAFTVGPKADPDLFKEICTINSILTRQDMHSNLAHLESLDGLSKKCIAPAVFSPPPFSLHPLFILLLNSSHAPYIYEQLVLGLTRHNLGWLDQVVMPLLDSTLPSHQQFIIDLFRQETPDKPSEHLKKTGGTIIVDRLLTITSELRNAEWVAGAIAALGTVRIAGAQELLHNILTSKHYMFFYDWPKACRNAAREAFAKMY